MSQLALQSNGEGASDSHQLLHGYSPKSTSWSTSSPASAFQDSPTIGRSQIHPSRQTAASSLSSTSTVTASYAVSPAASPTVSPTASPAASPTAALSTSTLSFSARSQRRPAPSPLHTTTTAVSPQPSPRTATSNSPSSLYDTLRNPVLPSTVTTSDVADNVSLPAKAPSRNKPYFQSSKGSAASPLTPEENTSAFAFPSRLPNDTRSASDPVIVSKPPEGSSVRPSPTMAGPPRVEAAKGAPRNSSIDSAISAISSGSHSHKASADSPAGPPDVANLIKTAGSPEAVIQYLLKEKTSQAQQNAQLWRLVDKQRAMILGLNKDLERALKDKEKYRKKLKELMSAPEVPPLPVVNLPQGNGSDGIGPVKAQVARSGPIDLPRLDVPPSPVLDSDSQRHSPVDMALAPYPITPPADQPNGPPSAVGELLDPSHSMPKAHEHALDQYDHEAEERHEEMARKESEDAKEMPLNLVLPPSRSLPSEPPRMPPPKPPVPAPTMTSDESKGIDSFPRPPAPPPRRPPPAPLQLWDAKASPTFPPGEEAEAEAEADSDDSDFDDLLEVTEITDPDRRGRRRTREEDDKEREMLAKQEAEIRSLSKKSRKSSGSAKGTPKEMAHDDVLSNIPASPRTFPAGIQQEQVPASLAGLLNGGDERTVELTAPPLMSPGLPSSPRPFGLPMSPLHSPPLSPRGFGSFGVALAPRPPRQPIPLPPNTPQYTPLTANANAEPLELKTPKPLNIVKKAMDAISGSGSSTSPTKISRESPVERLERPKVYTAFATEEYPDLLLPPNALPSIDIRVASSRMKPSRASLLSLTQLEEDPVFTLAIFSRAEGGELWRVEKDSLSLAKLDQRLKQCPDFTAKTPDRSLFSGHAPAKLDARRVALDQYLDELLNTPLDTATALELCKYLSTNTLPPNTDETGSPLETNSEINVSQKTGPGGRPFRNGYLTKRGKNFGGWKARFFVLDGPHLRYYETPGGAHLGTIKLQNAQIGKQSQHTDSASPARATGGSEEIDNQYRHAFLILEPKKKDPSTMTKHVLCAESDKERDQWVDALLRWIDYRDPDDEDPPKKEQAQERHGGSERPKGGANSKGKKSARSHEQQQQQQQSPFSESSDTLIGVSYETTQQGEAPQGAPGMGRPKGNNNSSGNSSSSNSINSSHRDHEVMPTMSSQSGYAISGPRDPQVISDSASWGGKMGGGLAPPDEKKARKRSFFGFTTKTRTSSDGNDSLFGGEASSPSPALSGQVLYANNQSRQVFGAPLAEAVRFNSPVDVRVPLPAVVFRCIQYLEAKHAISEEGIFRLSGSNVVIKALRERFNNESDVNLVADENYHDIHAVASLLKMYLRELPSTILTRDLHAEFLSVTEMPNSPAKIAALGELVERLPQANATLLKYLIAFLIKIINNSNTNKMTVRNVGIVFSPTLNIPAPVFAMFLQNYEGIFGIDPEEYELPSPVSEDHDYRRHDDASSETGIRVGSGGVRRPSMASLDQFPPRPSTSGTSGSPHRQRLMESVNDRQRSSPTPPPAAALVNPLMGLSQLQSSRQGPGSAPLSAPPAPPQRPQVTYEPQYMAQKNGSQAASSLRPAYESGFVVPQGFDLSSLHTPTGSRPNPGYDRPLYETNNNNNNGGGGGGVGSPYEAPYGGIKSSRRESAVFMGGSMGLAHQGSKSRLREESHY